MKLKGLSDKQLKRIADKVKKGQFEPHQFDSEEDQRLSNVLGDIGNASRILSKTVELLDKYYHKGEISDPNFDIGSLLFDAEAFLETIDWDLLATLSQNLADW